MSEDEASRGLGTALEEPRLQFFLKHRRQIRDWAAMADETREAVAKLLRGLLPDAESLFAERFGAKVRRTCLAERTSGSWRTAPNGQPVRLTCRWLSSGWDGRAIRWIQRPSGSARSVPGWGFTWQRPESRRSHDGFEEK